MQGYLYSNSQERAKIVPYCTDWTRQIPAGHRPPRTDDSQRVTSKFTAAVLPPLMTTATRSPACGLYAPDRIAEKAAAPPGSATRRNARHRVACALAIASSETSTGC